MEKIPAESGPWTIGVSKTCQVWPRSGEWKTRATLPPVANQMLESEPTAAEAPFFWVSDAALKRRSSTVADATDGEDKIAMQLLLAAKAPSPSTASGNCEGGIGRQVFPSSVMRSS